eukprot:17107-Karenia_brevis.AAC.1
MLGVVTVCGCGNCAGALVENDFKCVTHMKHVDNPADWVRGYQFQKEELDLLRAVIKNGLKRPRC